VGRTVEAAPAAGQSPEAEWELAGGGGRLRFIAGGGGRLRVLAGLAMDAAPAASQAR
jgi:hypothetical protein